jgi:AAHS family benzoate transporter-like MFS transporter
MPESVQWLASRGRIDEARAVAERTGFPMPDLKALAGEAKAEEKTVGFVGLFKSTPCRR